MIEKKDVLFNLLSDLRTKLDPESYHLYHLKTINNYVNNFNELTYKSKEKAFELLNSYFYDINGMIGNGEFSSLGLFKKYISPLIILYEREAGFTTYVKPWIFLVWYFTVELVVYIITKSVFIFLIVSLLFCMYYSYMYAKQRNGKVQGYLY